MANPRLPKWASEAGTNVHDLPIVRVDADAAYTDLLDEYRAFYKDGRHHQVEWKNKDGSLSKEWGDAMGGLRSEIPDAYWLEVCFQSIKMDLQVAMKTFTFEIRISDPGKRWAQAFVWLDKRKSGPRPQGRGPEKASGGPGGGREARQHYKRLRGFIPS